MKILHTSDWHLGKHLEGKSRIEEQKLFIEDFISLVEEKEPNMVIISGDIYDTSNPQAIAEVMFYDAIERISEGGKRVVLVIAGNHDNPDRVSAAYPIAKKHGIIMLGKPKSTVTEGKLGNHELIKSKEGFLKLKIGEEVVNILSLPYPSEKRLGEVIYDEIDDENRQRSYSDRVKQAFYLNEKELCAEEINIAVSHIYLYGGEESGSERSIQLGGSLSVSKDVFPKQVQYVALGHLHRPQKIKCDGMEIRYSGSPLQYSKSERGYVKGCYEIDINNREVLKTEFIPFKTYKPIEVWKVNNIEEAIDRCRENEDKEQWVYLEIKTDVQIMQEHIKEMKSYKKDIIEIKPILNSKEERENYEVSQMSIKELFKEFYESSKGVNVDEEVMEMFLKIVEDGEEK